MRTLLAEGQDVNVKTSRGQTPLILAAFFGHARVVRVLLEAGADVRVKDSLGLTAMEWSTRRGFPEVTQLFQNTPPADRGSPGMNEEEEKARREAEAQRMADEVRTQAEEESRKKLEEERRRIAEDEKPGQTISPAATLESTASESLKDSDIKRCPKCNRVYRSDILAYCSYDSARLVSEGDPAFSAGRKPGASARSTLWVLVMITLLGSGIVGYLVNNYIYGERSPDAPITKKTEQPANVEQDQPVIGGRLNGKETSLPNPEYPARAKSEGLSGKVTVAVRVNQKGIVVSARALNGPPLLKLSAVEAARKAKFSPEKLADQGSRVSGTITYNFKL